MEVFSARLKWLREKKGYSQKEMADLLGVSQPYYFKFEKGTGQPNLETLKKLPEILGESLDLLLGVTDYDIESRKFYAQLREAALIIKHGRDELKFFSDPQFSGSDDIAERRAKVLGGMERYNKLLSELKLQYKNIVLAIPCISDKTKSDAIDIEIYDEDEIFRFTHK